MHIIPTLTKMCYDNFIQWEIFIYVIHIFHSALFRLFNDTNSIFLLSNILSLSVEFVFTFVCWSGKFFWAHWKSNFKGVHLRAGFRTSSLVWNPIVVQYSTYASVKWKLEASISNILRTDSEEGDVLRPAVLRWNIFTYL